MKKIMMSLALIMFFMIGAKAQKHGDLYVGAGDIANKAWTDWSITPTVGYGVTDNLMVGMNISQADSTVDVELDLHARYFYKGYFAYMETTGLNTDKMKIGVGKMFPFHKGMYLDPKVIYDVETKTTNLMLGLGLRFCKY